MGRETAGIGHDELPPSLGQAIGRCRLSIEEHWDDVETDDDEAAKASSPFWRLIEAIADSDSDDLARSRLAHIALFAARRALAC